MTLMDILIIILVAFNLALVVLLLLRKPTGARTELMKLNERLIRIEGELDKLSPKIESEFPH